MPRQNKIKLFANNNLEQKSLKGEEKMKEGFVVGVLFGALAGMIIYRYSTDVQKLADKGEKMVKSEIKMMEQEQKKPLKVQNLQLKKIKIKNNKKIRNYFRILFFSINFKICFANIFSFPL